MMLFFAFFAVMFYVRILLFFFFQAEDGIRDATVTGVQTCGLPIWASACCEAVTGPDGDEVADGDDSDGGDGDGGDGDETVGAGGEAAGWAGADRPDKIGRASCRGRGAQSEGVMSDERRSGVEERRR